MYTADHYALIISLYCNIEYIYKYYNTKDFSFPKDIIDLINNFAFNRHDTLVLHGCDKDFKSGIDCDKDKLKLLPRRIGKEIQRLSKSCPPGVKFYIHPENWRYFLVIFEGPSDTPYEGGTFYAELFLPKDYPRQPPKCRFLTRIFHPNIDKLGRICLDILKDKWTPALNISRIALSIQMLLQDPLSDDRDPLSNRRQHPLGHMSPTEIYTTAREFTQMYAMHETD